MAAVAVLTLTTGDCPPVKGDCPADCARIEGGRLAMSFARCSFGKAMGIGATLDLTGAGVDAAGIGVGAGAGVYVGTWAGALPRTVTKTPAYTASDRLAGILNPSMSSVTSGGLSPGRRGIKYSSGEDAMAPYGLYTPCRLTHQRIRVDQRKNVTHPRVI